MTTPKRPEQQPAPRQPHGSDSDSGAYLRDQARLKEIAALGLLAPDANEALQDIVEAAAEALNLPIALVSIVLDEAQHFAAAHGLAGWMAATRGTPVEWSFCANAVRSQESFVVEDARTHPLTHDNPLVHEDGIRCYAGIPLVSRNGFVLGTLCVIGDKKRTFTEEDLTALRRLARKAVDRLEARRRKTP